MKKFLLSFLLMSASLSLFAGVVSVQEAQRKAEAFWQSKVNTRAGGPITLAMTEQKTSATRAESPAFYVFTAEERGFVIVSADDRTKEILGYSFDNKFDAQNIPANMKHWFSEYAAQISYEGKSYTNLVSGFNLPLRKPATRAERAEISPFVQTKWNQMAPYNEKCPVDANGKRSVTGCVATAIAQAMSVWKYPDTLPAVDAYVNASTNETVEAIEAHTIDWSAIKNEYRSDELDDNIAWLMRHCGQEVEMGYTAEGSGANSQYAVRALRDFGYDESVINLERFHYTTEAWENIIYNELAGGRPVLYGGRTAGDEGHEFICDGYMDEFFHINWGWGGMSDGYFLLSALDPGAQGVGGSDSGFDYDQSVIIGIAHGQGGVAEKFMISSDETLEDNVFDCLFWNCTGYTLDWEFGIGYIDAENNINPLALFSAPNTPTSSYFSNLNFDLASSGFPSPGSYKVVPISRVSETEKWYVGSREDVFVTVVVAEDGSISSSLSIQPTPEDPDTPKEFIVEAEITGVEGPNMVDFENTITFSLTNVGTSTRGVIILSLTDSVETYEEPVSVSLKPGSTGHFAITFIPENPGTNIFAIKNEAGEVLAQTEMEIVSYSEPENPILVETIVLDPTSYDLQPEETLQLVATVLPENATNKEIIWTSSNEDVVKVDAKGLVSFVNFGDATVTAIAADGSGVSAICIFSNVDGIISITTDSGAVEIHTLDGKKVQNAGKGIYIINRKKVLK